jgi:hypothetical protein
MVMPECWGSQAHPNLYVLEDWCQKSTFRKNPEKGDKRYADEAKELTHLYQAFVAVR